MRDWSARACDACGDGELLVFADLGTVPVLCGVHWAEQAEALASPGGQMVLAYCPACAYVRNVGFEPDRMVYDTTMDTNLHHSPAFQQFSRDLVGQLTGRFRLAGGHVIDIGCGQGEFLRELCAHAGCTGTGWDAMYAGATGPDPSGAVFHTGFAPRGPGLGRFDAFTSRHWFEHLDDPYEFLVDLREQSGDRPVRGYVEVPDAGYDLATAGWEVIYPHVSYFDAYSLCRIFTRAGWQVDGTGTYFSGMFRWIEVSANAPAGPSALPDLAARDRQLAAIETFAIRRGKEREQWQGWITDLAGSGARPVLWGAGSRSVQFLHATDPDRRLSAVVDVNPRKWGRYLPGAGHRVDPPASLAWVRPETVIITNPAYRAEIGRSLAELGLRADILVA